MDLAEYCRPQEYAFAYEDQDEEGEWCDFDGYVEAHSEAEAKGNIDHIYCYWWGLYHVGPVEPERIGR